MWTTKHSVILGSVSVASLSVGCASGWLLAQRVLAKKFELKLVEEIKQTKIFYDNLNKPDPDDLAQELLDEEAPLLKHPYDTTSSDVPQEVLERIAGSMARAQQEIEEEAAPWTGLIEVPKEMPGHNAFENPAPAWVQEDEELERRNGVPYIISYKEFMENEWEYEEGQLTYYEGDDTLADSRDEPIPQQYEAVGELTLEKFGHGSNDPNIVYVCNEKMEMVFEICRSTKSFAEDVLGFIPEDKELKHSDRRFKDSRARG